MIAVNIYYTGTNGSARKFAQEMIDSGTVQKIREEQGNIRYEYFYPVEDEETVLLIDCWENQEAIDVHHASEMMNVILKLREKYDLHMKVDRFTSDEIPPKFVKAADIAEGIINNGGKVIIWANFINNILGQFF